MRIYKYIHEGHNYDQETELGTILDEILLVYILYVLYMV